MYEPTQKGNPYCLTKKQHIHSAYCIKQFCDSNEKVELFNLSTSHTELKNKDAKIFCASRSWDEGAEKGVMGEIERNFHHEIDIAALDSNRNHQAISKYHLLWALRYFASKSASSDVNITGHGDSNLTKDQTEIAESKWGFFSRPNGDLPHRFMSGLSIRRNLDEIFISCYSGVKWGLFKAEDGEFLVADCYFHNLFMPVKPNLAFIGHCDDRLIDLDHLAYLNSRSKSIAQNFCFGKNLKNCTLYKNDTFKIQTCPS